MDKVLERKEKNKTFYTVVKRNGKLVPFHKDRIFNAIESAFRDTKKLDKEATLDSDIKEMIHALTKDVVDQLTTMASRGTRLTVEGIQDIVEVTLMKHGQHDIARDYIIYRDHRKELRKELNKELKIFKHDQATSIRFNPMKIAASIEKAFRRFHKIDKTEQTPQQMIQSVNTLTAKVVEKALSYSSSLTFAMIQDFIELELMQEKFFDVAKSYILHRSEKEKLYSSNETPKEPPKNTKEKSFKVLCEDGIEKKITESKLKHKLAFACKGFEDLVSASDLFESSVANFYQGMKESEIDTSNIMAARSKIEKEPTYSYVAARLLLDVIYREILKAPANDRSLKEIHQQYFKTYIKEAVKFKRLSSDLLAFDLDELSSALDLKRDHLFNYLGLQTLYDRYFIHHEMKRLETPQIFWMRVAMGLAIYEEEKNKRAIEFYHTLSQFHYVCSTPTLFNSGTNHPQLSSCYLSTVMDDLHHIFKVIADDAQLSKWAGGIGNDWSYVRSTGAVIKGTNGKSQGVIPFLKVANDTAVAVNQCFAPDTFIYTADGVKPICEVKVKDLVLGVSGMYREVVEKFVYNQEDPMLSIKMKHSATPIKVTQEHPLYALEKNAKSAKWIEVKNLQKGDYIGQIIPKQVCPAQGIEAEDMYFYGILLTKASLSKDQNRWTLSENIQSTPSVLFIKNYLKTRQISFKEHQEGQEVQLSWMGRNESILDGTSGQISHGETDFIFGYEDLFDNQKNRRIAPKLSHLPKDQTRALLEGMGICFEKQEASFFHTQLEFIEQIRYQLLRLSIPSFATSFENGFHLHFQSSTTSSSDEGWFIQNGSLFTEIEEISHTETTPFVFDLKVETDESYMTTSGLAHNGGKRKGAMCAYLETWHLDIEDFLELRKNTGDERRRTHDMNTANWIPDLFMKRVREKKTWTLFSPDDVKDLHDLYGKPFEKRYEEYEQMVEKGTIKLFKKVEAVDLWRKMLSMLFETGHPWITFKDPSNIRSPQDHMGVVHSSNLCTEILLNTSKEETAVCNLGSINLVKHMGPDGIDEKKLASTIKTSIRMLDNVIDLNFYPIQEAKNANMRHRPIGLGIMGFQDALYIKKVNYASQEAVEFADEIMEMISYYAILSSSNLAKERGTYPSYKGSKWDQGLLPIDTLALLEEQRQGYLDVDRTCRLNWDTVRESLRAHGMRNSNTMAIAPTATIANITGITQSIEPTYKHLFVKSNLSGEFTTINPYLVEALKELKLWDDEMIDDLKYFDGSISEIERIPEEIKKIFPVAFEIEPDWLIECASRRQKWIDMGQSLNLYLSEASGKKLSQMYLLAWEKGLKTTYYLRSLGATQIEKSSLDINKRGIQPRWMKNKSASSDISVNRTIPKACSLEDGCESCQ